MHLPLIGGEFSRPDLKQLCAMVDLFLEHRFR